MTKSMKFSAKFGKFMFYFDLDDLGISEAGGKDFCRHGFPGYISAHSGISGQLCRGVFKAEHAPGIQKYFALHWPDSYF